MKHGYSLVDRVFAKYPNRKSPGFHLQYCIKAGMVAYICNLNSWEIEAKELDIQGHHSK